MDDNSSNGQSLVEPHQEVDKNLALPISEHANTGTRQSVVYSLKKNKIIWLCTVLGIILTLTGVIGYILIRNNADKVANSYTISLKSYLDQVYNKVNLSSIPVVDIGDSLLKLNKPKLPSIFLGTLSSKYIGAQTVMITSNNKLKSLDVLTAGFIAVNNYQQSSRDLITKWESEHKPPIDYSKSMDSYLEVLKQIKLLAEKTQAPNELKPDFVDISKKIDSMIIAFTSMISIYKTGNQTAFKTANDSFIVMSNEETLFEEKAFNAYYISLSGKLIDSVKGLKIYSESIK